MKLSVKERNNLIKAICEQTRDWDLEELLEYAITRRTDELSRCSDTCIQLEYKEFVDPDYEMP